MVERIKCIVFTNLLIDQSNSAIEGEAEAHSFAL